MVSLGSFGSAIAGGAVVAITIKAIDDFSSTFTKAESGLNLLASSAKIGAGIIAGVGVALAGVGVSSVKAAGDFEQTQIAFTTMLGSAEEAQSMLKELADFARKTPFTLTGIEEQSKKLLAYGIDSQNLMGDIKSLGDIAAGVGTDKLPQLTLAFGQVSAAGKLRGQEIRQFTEAGVPILQALADTMGKTTAEIQDMTSKGEIGFEDVRKAMYSLSGEGGRFENLMVKQSETMQGKFSNLQDTIQLMARDIGAALLPSISSLADVFLNDLLPAVEPLIPVMTDLFMRIINAVVPILPKVVDSLMRLVEFSIKLFDALTPLIEPLTELALVLFDALLQVLDALLPSLDSLIPAIVDLVKAVIPLIPAITQILVLIAQMVTAIGKNLGPAIEAVMPIIEFLIKMFSTGIEVISKLVGWVKELVTWIAKINLGVLEKVGSFIGGGISKIKGIIGVDDAIIRPNGEIIKTNPKDTLIATKNPESLGGGITVYIENVYGTDPTDLSRALSRELSNKISL